MISDSTSLAEARKRLHELYIPLPHQDRAFRQLQRCIERREALDRNSGLVIVGEAGTGKTYTLNRFERWARAHYPEYAERDSLILRIETPEEADPKYLATAILDALGDPFAIAGGTSRTLNMRVRRLLTEADFRAMAFDEFNHLFDGKTPRQAQIVTQMIKNYFNSIGIPIILLGLEGVAQFVAQSKELGQRFQRICTLPLYSLDNEDELRIFRGLLSEIGRVVPFAFDPTADEHLLRMLLATDGAVRNVIEVCLSACEEADDAGVERVTLDHLATVFDHNVLRQWLTLNPFDAEVTILRNEATKILQQHKQRRITQRQHGGRPRK